MSQLRKAFTSAIKSSKKSKKQGESLSSAPSSQDESFDTSTLEAVSIVGDAINGRVKTRNYYSSSNSNEFSSPDMPDFPTVSESRSDLDDHEDYPYQSSANRRNLGSETTNIDTFQMQMELVQLRERIKLLDNGTGESRSELLDLINERDEEVSQLNATIHNLKCKFKEINANLGQIGEERHTLRETVSSLEKENKNLKRHLHIREQEVVSLVKRLAGEEERLKEGIHLRSKNQSLITEIEQLKTQLDAYADLQLENQHLRDQIHNEANEKKLAQAEFNNLSKTYDEVQIENKRRLDQILFSSNAEKIRIKELEDIIKEREAEISSLKSASESLKREFDSVMYNEREKYDLKDDEMQADLREKCEIINSLNEQISIQKKIELDLRNQLEDQSREKEEHLKKLEEAKAVMNRCIKSESDLSAELQKMRDTLNQQEQRQYESERIFADQLSAAQELLRGKEEEIKASHYSAAFSLQKEMDERIEYLNSMLAAKEQTIASLENTTFIQTQTITALQSQLENLSADSKQKIEELQSLNENLTHNLSNLKALTDENVRVLSEEMILMEEERNGLLEQTRVSASELARMEQEKRETIASFNGQMERLQQITAQMEASCLVLKNENKVLTGKLKACEEQTSSLNLDISNKKYQLRDLQQRLDEIVAEHTANSIVHEQQIQMQRNEILLLQKECEEIKLKEAENTRKLEKCQQANLDLMEENGTLTNKLSQKEEDAKLVSDMQRTITELIESTRRLKNQKNDMEVAKDAEIAHCKKESDFLVKENEALKVSFQELASRYDREQEAVVSHLKKKLESNEIFIASLQATVASLEMSMQSLKGDLARQKQESTEKALVAREIEAALSLSKEEVESLRREYDALKVSMEKAFNLAEKGKNDAASTFEEQLKSKEATIISLQKDTALHKEVIKSLECNLAKQEIDAKQDILALRNKLERMQKARKICEEQVKGQEKTISEITCRLEDTIKENALLNSQLSLLKESIKTNELDSAEIVADLEEQIDGYKRQLENIQNSSRRNIEDQNILLNELQETLKKLKAEKILVESALRDDIDSLQSKYENIKKKSNERLGEQTSTISALMKRCSSQEHSLVALQNELDHLRNEHKTAIELLEGEAQRWRVVAEERREANSKEMKRMQQLVVTLEMKTAAQRDELENVRSTLNERTKLLGDMVAQNKATNSDLLDARALVCELQEESEKYLRARNDVENKISFAEKTKLEMEERYARNIQHERSLRQSIEIELNKLKDYMESKKSEVRSLAELERENFILKDKVVRQEQYLKRKLKQEKLLKERLSAFGGAKLSLDTCGSQSWDLGDD